MFSYPLFEQVIDDLGDKVVPGMTRSVRRARVDLREFRLLKPKWVVEATDRGLASLIHDRIWAHLKVLLDDIENVVLVDHEPLREIYIGTNYRLRVKRHHIDGSVRSYPTLAAREFFVQDHQPTLEGLEEIRLAVGYDWDSDLREIGDAVLSLRDGDDIIWFNKLPPPPDDDDYGQGDGEIRPLDGPPKTGPTAPEIGIGDESSSGEEGRST